MQTKTHSLIETCTNTAIGYLVALLSQVLVFPLFGIRIPLSSNIKIGLIFTVISIARGYILRRIFTHKTEAPNAPMVPMPQR